MASGGSGVVALHTQALGEPQASEYLDLLGRAVRAARLSKQFPDRRSYQSTLESLSASAHRGLYDSIFVDARSGLPNMASMTRIVADRHVAIGALPRMKDQAVLEARREDAEVFERLARKRPYYEGLASTEIAPVDEHRVLLRRHEPEHSRASFRVELTKLAANGCYLHVAIELSQTAGLWGERLVDLDASGEVAEGTEALRGMVYRFATFDAEALFLRLHELPGVTVERVARGVIGPVLFSLSDGATLAQAEAGPMQTAMHEWAKRGESGKATILAGFASDVAATDVREEKSNDPLSPLMSESIAAGERARYDAARERFPFRVYKDRKFAASPGLSDVVRSICEGRGTANIIYPVR
ncbi:MAG: hypothetical protein AAF721_22960 [Myxococcota bacterium]